MCYCLILYNLNTKTMITRKILFGSALVVSSLFLFGESRADVAEGCYFTGNINDNCKIVIPGYSITILKCKKGEGETCNYDFELPGGD